MKRYVSLAGAILVGTVVANEQKPAFKALAETQNPSVVKSFILATPNVASVSHTQ